MAQYAPHVIEPIFPVWVVGQTQLFRTRQNVANETKLSQNHVLLHNSFVLFFLAVLFARARVLPSDRIDGLVKSAKHFKLVVFVLRTRRLWGSSTHFESGSFGSSEYRFKVCSRVSKYLLNAAHGVELFLVKIRTWNETIVKVINGYQATKFDVWMENKKSTFAIEGIRKTAMSPVSPPVIVPSMLLL